MLDGRRTGVQVWGLLALLAIATSLWSFRAESAVNFCAENADCNCTIQQQLQNCDVASGAGGQCNSNTGLCQCNPGFGGANCDPLGACCNPQSNARGDGGGAGLSTCEQLTQADCQFAGGDYRGDSTSCYSQNCELTATPTSTPTATATETPTATATETATATATNTPGAPGSSCVTTADCEGNLVCDPEELVCCDRVCNEPTERCDLPGLEGTCSPITAQAPAVSQSVLPLVVGLLLALGGVAIVRRRITH